MNSATKRRLHLHLHLEVDLQLHLHVDEHAHPDLNEDPSGRTLDIRQKIITPPAGSGRTEGTSIENWIT